MPPPTPTPPARLTRESARRGPPPLFPAKTQNSLEIVSFTIRDVSDGADYLMSLGKKRTAEVKRDARIGEAEAERDAGVREAQANRERLAMKAEAETSIADAQRKFQMQQAQFEAEVNTERARTDMAGDLQRAKTRQDIKKVMMEVEIIVRRKKIEVEQQEVLRRSKELEAMVKKPAEAERCAHRAPALARALVRPATHTHRGSGLGIAGIHAGSPAGGGGGGALGGATATKWSKWPKVAARPAFSMPTVPARGFC